MPSARGITFPARPETDDEWRTQFLDLMSVEGFPNVFLLGPFAKYVTIYAQQVRALNLVAALASGGRLSARSRVGVVGGGIAGLTAAVAATEAGAGHVMVFEQEPSLMRLQRACEKRFVHPHVYDWPSPGAMEPDAGLPLMNWMADSADKVVSQLDRAWQEVAQRCVPGRMSEPRCGVDQIKLLSRGTPHPVLEVDGMRYEFDFLLLAVGFGRESPSSYWSDDDFGAIEHEKKPKDWLVSGIGDGGLTDLMRLCISDFKHAKVLAAVDERTRNEIGEDLLRAEQGTAQDRRDGFRAAARKIGPQLSKAFRFREVGKVYLNDRQGQLYESFSSILNRLITAWLDVNDRFEVVSGDLAPSAPGNDGRFEVRFGDRPPINVGRVVQRHGPERALLTQEWLRDVATAALPRSAVWLAARKQEDWTRERHFDSVFPGPGPNLAPVRLRVDFGQEIGCVVVTGHGEIENPNLRYRVGQALGRLAKAKGTERYGPGRPLSLDPVHLRAEEVFSSPANYERALRALCTAEIAVFDLTGHQSAVMLLLGVRSAVRRGLTVVVTQDERPDIPFNIAALNPVKASNDTGIAKALENGFAAMVAAGDRYLDLPAYDAVRALGDDFHTREPENEILILRWFDEEYADKVGDQIIRSHLVDVYGETTKILTVLDSRSPQLVEQRLYAAIRRTRLCVVDWTASRPNVFFETGVRLAVSEHHPLLILCDEKPAGWKTNAGSSWTDHADPWMPALARMFGLTGFNPRDPRPLADRLAAYKQDPVASARSGLLSPGRSYAVISEAIDRQREPAGLPARSLLLAQADLLAGPATLEEGEVPVLYGTKLKEQVRSAAVEHTLAAWYYHLGRHKLRERMDAKTLAKDDAELSLLEQIGRKLNARFRNASQEFLPFRSEVLAVLKQIQDYRKDK